MLALSYLENGHRDHRISLTGKEIMMKDKYLTCMRLIVLTALSVIMLFIAQKHFYESGRLIFFKVQNVKLADWIEQQYLVGAYVVFITSITATILWFFFTSQKKTNQSSDVEELKKLKSRWLMNWRVLLAIPIIGILIAVFYINKEPHVYFSLTLCFTFDVILLYWLPTTTSSLGDLKLTPPGAVFVRSFLGDR